MDEFLFAGFDEALDVVVEVVVGGVANVSIATCLMALTLLDTSQDIVQIVLHQLILLHTLPILIFMCLPITHTLNILSITPITNTQPRQHIINLTQPIIRVTQFCRLWFSVLGNHPGVVLVCRFCVKIGLLLLGSVLELKSEESV